MTRPAEDAPAFVPIGEAAALVGVEPHVLRFWGDRFPEVAPVRRAGGRRFYRAADVALLRAIRVALYERRLTIAGVRRLLDAGGIAALEAEGMPPVANDDGVQASRDALVTARDALAAALAAYRAANRRG